MSFIGKSPARAAIAASDIADNSIDASKIVDGSIDVADVSSDIVTLTGSQTLTNKTLGSGVTFPAGHVLQVKTGGYGTQTTIGTSQTYVIDLEFATIGTNSLFVATAHFSVGNQSDTEGFQGGVTLNSGSTPTTSGNAMIQGSPSSLDSGGFMYDDIGNGRLNGYAFTSHTWQLYKATTFAAGTTVSCGLWFKGINTMYINRCANRGSHEGSYTTLVIYEVAA